MTGVFRATIDFGIESKKNATRGWSKRRQAARQNESSLTALFQELVLLGAPTFGDDSTELRITFDKTTKLTHVEVRSIGKNPKRNNGRKQDVDNPATMIMDALQKAGVYQNDSGVGHLIVKRLVGGKIA